MGSLVAAAFVENDWSLSFIYPGLIIGIAGFLIFLFLVVNPADVGCIPPDNDRIIGNGVCILVTFNVKYELSTDVYFL